MCPDRSTTAMIAVLSIDALAALLSSPSTSDAVMTGSGGTICGIKAGAAGRLAETIIGAGDEVEALSIIRGSRLSTRSWRRRRGERSYLAIACLWVYKRGL